MNISTICFEGKPKNYGIIDKYVSRSAQPQKEDLVWLKEQGVTDVFNFRTMVKPAIDYDEQKEVEMLGMKYHNIPSITSKPSKENVKKFLSEIETVILKNGKAHVHCMAGADRTGMYSLIYKSLKNINSWTYNVIEMLLRGHYFLKYPHLISWAKKYVQESRKLV